jgi:hypothetical protein
MTARVTQVAPRAERDVDAEAHASVAAVIPVRQTHGQSGSGRTANEW